MQIRLIGNRDQVHKLAQLIERDVVTYPAKNSNFARVYLTLNDSLVDKLIFRLSSTENSTPSDKL